MSKVNFVIKRCSEEGDGCPVELLGNGKSCLYGDEYHDKIDQRIEGYIQAFEDLGHDVTTVTNTDEKCEYCEP